MSLGILGDSSSCSWVPPCPIAYSWKKLGISIDQTCSIHGTIRGRAGGLCKLVAMAVALADCSGQLRWSGVVRLVYNGLFLIEVGRGEIDLVGFLWTLNSNKPMCNDMFHEWSR